ncbi:M56 family metallopeptidase [Nocardioides sp.]|uniref:Putative Peptidase family M48 n=1 Tax=metagenome TaxID=256318 RepID=A0A2P2BX47_9ZZZZ
MIAAFALVSVALALAWRGHLVLANADWTVRLPRLGVIAWQAVSWSALFSVVLAGIALALPTLPFGTTDNGAAFLGVCAFLVREHYDSPGGFLVAVFGAGIALAVTARALSCLVSSLWNVGRIRARQRTAISLIARVDAATGVMLIDDPRPAVYCMPGRVPVVVMTSGAAQSLTGSQLATVLAHERAHLEGRHDMALVGSGALQRAFPFVPLFGHADKHVAALLEMRADDRALQAGDRMTLATALVRLAQGTTPMGALGAGGETALVRVRRLVTPPAQVTRVRRGLIVAAISAVLATPLLIAAAPAAEAVLLDYCPVWMHGPGPSSASQS